VSQNRVSSKKSMIKDSIKITDLDIVKQTINKAADYAKGLESTHYADIRVEASQGTGAYSEDGNPKGAVKDWGLSIGVRVIAGKSMSASGFYGRQLGIPDFLKFEKTLKEAFLISHLRAIENSKYKSKFVTHNPKQYNSIVSTKLAPIKITNTKIEAEFKIDPRGVKPHEITDFVCKAALSAKKFHTNVKKVEVSAGTGISRQIFVSSEGTLIDQSYTSTGGTVFVVATENGKTPADLYHHTGNQLGFETILNGKNTHEMDLVEFAKEIANEAVLLSCAEPAPQTSKDTTVVLDPDLVALFAHEIIGHPSELDRAMKMETGYAGRSWFMKDFKDNMIGKQVGSHILTAFSDPTLKGGYGHYLYDDEGTPARRVYHIRKGIYEDFMNSRETAAIFDSNPNGHYKANDASVVPLIRMSVSAIEAGHDDPKKIIGDVEDGFYCVGHRIPSISESRENFQIAPRLIYKIKNGRLGEIYRDGRVTADSKNFFMSIDALGSDFKIFAIPNCGKGQPKILKQVGNGGPTARARAKIARG